MEIKKKQQITKKWFSELQKLICSNIEELEKTYGSNSLKKLMYLDQKSIECGGESKQIAAKQLSPKEKFRKNCK